ncbi:sensor histidine kinase [Winogradskyella algicola]|uniref:sensor histidine kinase n=1 Tax=Winogradskyella algicola TaxID=2575815 RepID=UPI001109B1B1|nr:sensor histidine kinase [Winogradskyella algicola]
MKFRFLFFLFLSHCLFSQNTIELPIDDIKSQDSILKIEKYILNKEHDSAIAMIEKIKKSSYVNALYRIASNNNPTYIDYTKLINSLTKNPKLSYQSVSDYINLNVEKPTDTKKIDLDYVKIKVNQISKLRDDISIESASKIQEALDNYINAFNGNNDDVKKAKIYSSTHQIVLYIIQQDIEKGKKLCLENFDEAKKLNDNELMITSLYYLCDFLVLEGKLNEYIEKCELSLELEKSLTEHSPYYIGTLVHIIDAYIYKGGEDEKVKLLLKELYNDKGSSQQSYSLYAKYLGTIDLESKDANDIFDLFKVNDIIGFSKLTSKLGEQTLNPNDQYQLIREISQTLENHNYLKEAIYFKDQTVVQIKKIYSQDLASSLASYKVNQAEKEKNLSVAHEKERTNLYIIIATLVGFLFLISAWAYFKKKKQSEVLKEKNRTIEVALKEKELLVKEVHHRVKNNFQIVSSLLELQTNNIEDKKALQLIEDGQNRLRSMAIIHQKLYQNKDGLIDFNDYITLLVKELTSLYDSDKKIEIHIDINKIFFDIDTAIPLGLIINELVTNAYKYAFKEEEGKLNISIDKSEEYHTLKVYDNGTGLNTKTNFDSIKTTGLRLVKRLVKQIHGNIEYKNRSGAYFVITFKDTKSRKTVN